MSDKKHPVVELVKIIDRHRYRLDPLVVEDIQGWLDKYVHYYTAQTSVSLLGSIDQSDLVAMARNNLCKRIAHAISEVADVSEVEDRVSKTLVARAWVLGDWQE